MAVLKQRMNLDMTLVIKNDKQFDMTKGLSEREKIIRAQKAAEDNIQFGEAKHGGPGAFDFNDNHDDVKTVTPGKKVGTKATE